MDMDKNTIGWGKRAIVILLVVVLGLVAVNQTLGYYYKAQFLKTPCALCAELNPEVQSCLYSKAPEFWELYNSTRDLNLTINEIEKGYIYVNLDDINKTNLSEARVYFRD